MYLCINDLMKKTVLHRIIALTLAFVMFFTSVGFSVDIHYCRGDLKSFSLIGEASTCHQAKKTCPSHKEMMSEETSEDSKCCSNKTVVVDDLDVDYDISPDVELTDLQVKFVTARVYTLNGFTFPEVVKSDFPKTDDPLPPRDIYVLLERFLI